MYYLGIDIGSASISLVLLNNRGGVLDKKYCLLKGVFDENREFIKNEIKKMFQAGESFKIAVSGSNSEKFNLPVVNEISALVQGVRHVAPNANSIMEIGGESAKCVVGLKSNNIQFAVNSNCSAGTGSFLAAQMQRLDLPLNEYSSKVAKAKNVPRIAGRCSVFAKTDIIHSQQAGVSVEDILLGLCYAVVRNFKASVSGKLAFVKPIFFTGGTSLNAGVITAIKDVFELAEEELIVPETALYATAIGTALLAKNNGKEIDVNQIDSIFHNTAAKSEKTSLPALKNPCMDIAKLQQTEPYITGASYHLGIDIGSTSTNLVLLNKEEEVVHFQYLRTKGDPVKTVQLGFEELRQKFGDDLRISSVATTGSGRHLVGRIIGADTVQDEITAQAIGAVRFMPDVDTIMEIGGQDSKYISIQDGLVRNFNMNKICAAGTGAFIEEQAARLDIPIQEYGEVALLSESPAELDNRCTVLIESNINTKLINGASKEDIAAGLCHSIVSNYINRVVGDRPIGNQILLLGGVAYNSAIVAAFKERFGERICVGRYFNVNGAIGAALLGRKFVTEKTTFKGLNCLDNFEKDKINKPQKAANYVKRKPIASKREQKQCESKDPEKKTIGLPRALYGMNTIPFATLFFEQLGYNVICSDESSEQTIRKAQSYACTEVCYPLKLAIGHSAQLLEKDIDYLFMPSLISLEEMRPLSEGTRNRACVYMQSAPSMLKTILNLEQRGVELLAPALDLSKGKKTIFKALQQIGMQLGHSVEDFRNVLQQISENLPKGAKNRGDVNMSNSEKPVFVILARGYCAKDPMLNLGITQMLEDRGYQVLIPKQIPGLRDESEVAEQYPTMYWTFVSRMLSAAKIISRTPNLYPIYLTYHGCGPDSMALHWMESEFKNKPALHIEVDEHFSNVGIITRLDAFINSVIFYKDRKDKKNKTFEKTHNVDKFKTNAGAIDPARMVVIPHAYPYSGLLASYLEGKGFNVKELSPTSQLSLSKGRSYMQGKEYYSLSALLGNVAMETDRQTDFQLLYPRNNGAEADGMYSYFIHSKLSEKIAVVSPSLEDLASDKRLADALLRIALAGDIALALDDDKLFDDMKCHFYKQLPSNEVLMQWTRYCSSSDDFLLVLGEPYSIFDDLFQKTILQPFKKSGLKLRFMPMSEAILSEWGKIENVDDFEKKTRLMEDIASAMGGCSMFSENNDNIAKLDFLIPQGGFASYRHAKMDFKHSKLRGIIRVASQYENSGSILELAPNYLNVPVLDIYFDGTDEPINKLKIDTFLSLSVKA